MKIFGLILFLVSGFINCSFGQFTVSYEVQETIDFYKTNKFITESKNNGQTGKKINGSPYLNDEFVTGTIYTVQRKQYADIPLRYNIYNDDLEFKTQTDEVQALTTPDIVEKAVLGDIQLVYSPYILSNKSKNGFFVLLEEGKASLYAKPGVLFREATEPGAYKDPEPAKFVKKSDSYYIRVGSGKAQLIGNKKELIAAFPDNRDRVEKFISKNKIKINKAESLKELFRYYNAL